MILQGEFSPIKPSKELYEAIYKESNIRLEKRALDRLPVDEMIDIYQGLLKKSLLSGGVESIDKELPLLPVDQTSSSSAPEMPVLDVSKVSPINNTATTSSTQTRTNPAFLGSNPIDILKNLTIGNRTQ
jgi:hypothetical protein